MEWGYRNKRFLSRIFFSLLATASLILIPATLLNYALFSRIVTEEIHAKSLGIPRLMVSAFGSWHYSFMPYSTTLIQDSQVSRLIYGKELSELEKLAGLSALNLMHVSNPLVHSVYIYNYQAHRVFSTLRGEEDPDACSDPDLMGLVGYGTRIRMYAYQGRKLRWINTDGRVVEENVFSVIVGFPGLRTGSLKGGMVVNLSEKRLRELLADSGKAEDQQFFILDPQDRFLSHPDPSRFYTLAGPEDPTAAIMASGKREGSFIIGRGKEKKLLAYSTQDELGWIFVHVSGYGAVDARLASLRNGSLLVFVLLFFLALGAALWRSRLLYKPIEGLMRGAAQLQYYSGTEDNRVKPQASEFYFLGEALRLAGDTMRSQRHLRSLEMLAEIFLGKRDSSEAPLHLAAIGWEPSARGYRAALICFDGYGQLRTKIGYPGIAALKTKIKDSIGSMAMDSILLADTGDDEMAAVFKEDGKQEGNRDFLIDALTEFRTEGSCTLTIGISGIVVAPEDLPVAYSQAKRAVLERFRQGGNRLIRYESLPPQSAAHDLPHADSLSIFKMLNMGKVDQAVSLLEEQMDAARKGSPEDFIRLVRSLVVQFEQHAADASQEVRQDLYELIQGTDGLRKPETVDDTILGFRKAFDRYSSLIKYEKRVDKQALAQRVDGLVEKNMGNPNLCPDTLAIELGISTNYLRTVYKQTVGKSLTDRIRDRRMEEARSLLAETELPVKEIALRVGFSNYNYFFTGFRQSCGMTPVAYRERNRRAHGN